MKTKSLIILALVTAVAVAGAAWAVVDRQRMASVAEVPDALFPGLIDKVNDVRRVEISAPRLKFAIVRGEDGNWSVPERNGYPVKFETVKQAVVGIAGLRPLEVKTARPELHGKLGLRLPDDGGKGTLIVLKDGSGAEIAGVVIGSTKSLASSAREGWNYVRLAGNDQSWLAAGRVEVWDEISRWLDDSMPIIDRPRIRSVHSERPGGEVIDISRTDPNGRDFTVDNIPEGWKMIHDTVANPLGSALGYLTFEDVAPVGEIDFSDAVSVQFHTFDGLVFAVDVIRLKGAYWGRFKARFDPAQVALDGLTEAQRKSMLDAEAVQKEAARINDRYGVWAYRFPDYKGKDFTIAHDDLIVRKKGS
jgi:hypothetical protein